MKPSAGTTNDANIIKRMQSMATAAPAIVAAPIANETQPDKKTPDDAQVEKAANKILAKIAALLKGQ